MARQPTKCCGCAPLRPGLLAWAYIKLVIALTSIGAYLSSYEMRNFVDHYNYILLTRYISPAYFVFERLWPLGVCLLYLVFSIIFIVGMHRENIKLLQVFRVYSMFEVMVGAVAVVELQLFHVARDLFSRLWHVHFIYNYFNGNYEIFASSLYDIVFYLTLILPVVINILLPIYFIVLIKSEVQRLKRARGETRAVVCGISVINEQDKKYSFV